MASALIKELEHYIAMAKSWLKATENNLAIAKSKKEACVMATVKACGQMEDHDNHLCEQEVLLQTLITKMENFPTKKKEDLQQHIEKKKVSIYSRVCRCKGLCL